MSIAIVALTLSVIALATSTVGLLCRVDKRPQGFKWTGWVKAKDSEPTNYHVTYSGEHPDKAVFITTDRVSEILSAKPDANIDDVLS